MSCLATALSSTPPGLVASSGWAGPEGKITPNPVPLPGLSRLFGSVDLHEILLDNLLVLDSMISVSSLILSFVALCFSTTYLIICSL